MVGAKKLEFDWGAQHWKFLASIVSACDNSGPLQKLKYQIPQRRCPQMISVILSAHVCCMASLIPDIAMVSDTPTTPPT